MECNGEHEAMDCDLSVSEIDPKYVSRNYIHRVIVLPVVLNL